MASVTGQRGTNNISADQIKVEIGNRISLLEPDSNPLTLLSRAAKKEGLGNPDFNYLEMDAEPRFDSVNGAVASTTTTSVTVANGSRFAEHQIVENTTTREIFRIVSVAGNVLTVVRGAAGSTAVNIGNADELLIIGIAQPEGDTSRPSRSSNPTKLSNYMQIQRETFDITGTLLSTDNQISPHDWQFQEQYHGIEHAKNIEYTNLFGGAAKDTSGSQPRRTTKGVVRSITTNVTDASGALSETEFTTFQRSMARYGNKRRTLFASALVMGVLNGFAMGKLNVTQNATTYGLAVTNYVSPFGSLDAVYHPLLEGTRYGGYALALDMNELAYVYLNGGPGGSRDTHLRRNIQEPDRDGVKHEYLSECGLRLGSEKKHGLLIGVTS